MFVQSAKAPVSGVKNVGCITYAAAYKTEDASWLKLLATKAPQR